MSPGLAKKQLSWTLAADPPALKTDEIHLWLARTEDIGGGLSGETSSRKLSKAERIRASRLEAQIGIKVLLASYTGCPIHRLEFVFGAKGKPALDNALNWLQFNYSVSSGYALYAFSGRWRLGVDLEIHPRDVHVQRLYKRVLSSTEKRCFDEFPEAQHNACMLDWWTRKEAYGKLLGVGIRYNMKQTTLIQEPNLPSWHSKVTGLFDDSRHGIHNDTVHGTQIELPIAGSAAVMYDALDAQPPRPDLLAFKWSG